MNAVINARLLALRKLMQDNKADYYLFTSMDYHSSEYVSDYFKESEYFTGFTGENATVLIGLYDARLWTDGRFFIQAEKELNGTGIILMKSGQKDVPTVLEYLDKETDSNITLMTDGRTISDSFGEKLNEILHKKGGMLLCDSDYADRLWKDRPSFPSGKITAYPDDYFGENSVEKLKRIREKLISKNCNANFIAKLDDIMWVTNLRGSDIECNPVAMSYLYIDLSNAHLFINASCLSKENINKMNNSGIIIHSYSEVYEFLENVNNNTTIMVNGNEINYRLMSILRKRCSKVVTGINPSTEFKAIKNPTEIKRLKEITLLDSVAVTKFIYWLKHNISKISITEKSAADYLDNLRREIPGFIDLSFPTISAYGSNAAMMHYFATNENNSECKAKGMLLVDSGGQYEKGTTDITRTIVLGEISDIHRMHYSKVCASMLALKDTVFLYGCTGRNLDIIAREPLWKMHMDYKCGTGHGIGYILNVHEGPQSIRWKYSETIKETVLEEGMLLTDEPGVYIENSHGIRIENELLIKKIVENDDGIFMGFENLTYTPLDREALDKKYLSKEDIKRINAYHKEVYKFTKNYLNEDERKWLYEVTRAL